MKRSLKGNEAYTTMMSAELPERTKTYTPILHGDIVSKVKSEISKAGFSIIDEQYRASNNGQIALGTFKLKYKDDPDVDLCVNFLNSYNKQYAFRFNLGALVKISSTAMILNDGKIGSYKKVHKGDADMLAEGKIAEFIKGADEYWETVLEHKDKLKDMTICKATAYEILGELFFGTSILNTMQMNIIDDELRHPSFDYKVGSDNAWALYNHIALSLKESRPDQFITSQMGVHEVFSDVLGLIEEVDPADLTDEELEEEERREMEAEAHRAQEESDEIDREIDEQLEKDAIDEDYTNAINPDVLTDAEVFAEGITVTSWEEGGDSHNVIIYNEKSFLVISDVEKTAPVFPANEAVLWETGPSSAKDDKSDKKSDMESESIPEPVGDL